jgi:outer membrane murein-binding lipoprotein Lpp
MPNPDQAVALDHVLQQEQRIVTIDREVGGLKTDVGVLKADVRTLAAGQATMQVSQDKGFEDIKASLIAKSREPAKIGIGTLISMLGVLLTAGVVGITAFWAAVTLLANPIKDDAVDLKEYLGDTPERVVALRAQVEALTAVLDDKVALTDGYSLTRHEEQARQILAAEAELLQLQTKQMEILSTVAELSVTDDWLRDDVDAVREDARIVRAEALTATAAQKTREDRRDASIAELTGQVQNLRGLFESLTERVQQIDTEGSRGTNLRLNAPRTQSSD